MIGRNCFGVAGGLDLNVQDQYINHIMNEIGATVMLKGRGSGNNECLNGEDGQYNLYRVWCFEADPVSVGVPYDKCNFEEKSSVQFSLSSPNLEWAKEADVHWGFLIEAMFQMTCLYREASPGLANRVDDEYSLVVLLKLGFADEGKGLTSWGEVYMEKFGRGSMEHTLVVDLCSKDKCSVVLKRSLAPLSERTWIDLACAVLTDLFSFFVIPHPCFFADGSELFRCDAPIGRRVLCLLNSLLVGARMVTFGLGGSSILLMILIDEGITAGQASKAFTTTSRTSSTPYGSTHAPRSRHVSPPEIRPNNDGTRKIWCSLVLECPNTGLNLYSTVFEKTETQERALKEIPKKFKKCSHHIRSSIQFVIHFEISIYTIQVFSNLIILYFRFVKFVDFTLRERVNVKNTKLHSGIQLQQLAELGLDVGQGPNQVVKQSLGMDNGEKIEGENAESRKEEGDPRLWHSAPVWVLSAKATRNGALSVGVPRSLALNTSVPGSLALSAKWGVITTSLWKSNNSRISELICKTVS
ncbi:hypothetical protein Fmac_015109 [Flemingia macrophylla]|uniref:Uncharacterized protein n=1 Tax=Flemingia macrophylla TaxID=520843 RepID=A0ABD1MDL9_9FABA